jgi:hypothetical protein
MPLGTTTFLSATNGSQLGTAALSGCLSRPSSRRRSKEERRTKMPMPDVAASAPQPPRRLARRDSDDSSRCYRTDQRERPQPRNVPSDKGSIDRLRGHSAPLGSPTLIPAPSADSTGRRNASMRRSCDGSSSASWGGSCGAGSDAVAGSAAGGAVGAPPAVLGGDRSRCVERGRGRRGGCVGGGRCPVVSRGWRDAVGQPASAVGTLLVVS